MQNYIDINGPTLILDELNNLLSKVCSKTYGIVMLKCFIFRVRERYLVIAETNYDNLRHSRKWSIYVVRSLRSKKYKHDCDYVIHVRTDYRCNKEKSALIITVHKYNWFYHVVWITFGRNEFFHFCIINVIYLNELIHSGKDVTELNFN